MIDSFKIAGLLFISIFGLTIYSLHKNIFFLGPLKSFFCFVFVGIISSTTVYFMGNAYLKVLSLKEIDNSFENKSVYQTISTKLALLFSIIMIIMNFLFSIVIFIEVIKILLNCFEFFNLKYENIKTVFTIFIIFLIIGIQFLNQKIKNIINSLNIIIIFLFFIFLSILYFMKSHNNKINNKIEKIKDYNFLQLIASLFFAFSCQHVSIATFTKSKKKTLKNFLFISILLSIFSIVGVYLISLLSYFIVRNEKIFDKNPFNNNFLFEISSKNSYFFNNFLIKQSKFFQYYTIFSVIIMCYLLINSISILMDVILRAFNEIFNIFIINFSIKKNYNIIFNNKFQIIFISTLIVFASFIFNPEILIKYISIVFGNIICFIIPGLMYYLISNKLAKKKENIIENNYIFNYISILLIIGGIILIFLMILFK